MRHQIVHAIRGRLRVRYPVPWLRARQSVLESHLRGVAGVRSVTGRGLTGSIQIEYDPFRLTEQTLVQTNAERVGLGVDVRIDGAHVLIGSRRLMELHEVILRRAAADEAAARATGASPLFVAVDDQLAAMLVLEDQLREDAPRRCRPCELARCAT